MRASHILLHVGTEPTRSSIKSDVSPAGTLLERQVAAVAEACEARLDGVEVGEGDIVVGRYGVHPGHVGDDDEVVELGYVSVVKLGCPGRGWMVLTLASKEVLEAVLLPTKTEDTRASAVVSRSFISKVQIGVGVSSSLAICRSDMRRCGC